MKTFSGIHIWTVSLSIVLTQVYELWLAGKMLHGTFPTCRQAQVEEGQQRGTAGY